MSNSAPQPAERSTARTIGPKVAQSSSCAEVLDVEVFDVRRVALLGDTHGWLDPRAVALARCCDLIVHTGDIGSDSVVESLHGLGKAVRFVRGNNDIALKWDGGGEILPQLPLQRWLSLPGGVLAVEHGDRVRCPVASRHSILRERHPTARAVVYGHSHRRCIDTEQVPWVLNPGAAGAARTFGGASMLILKVSEQRWSVQEQVWVKTNR